MIRDEHGRKRGSDGFLGISEVARIAERFVEGHLAARRAGKPGTVEAHWELYLRKVIPDITAPEDRDRVRDFALGMIHVTNGKGGTGR